MDFVLGRSAHFFRRTIPSSHATRPGALAGADSAHGRPKSIPRRRDGVSAGRFSSLGWGIRACSAKAVLGTRGRQEAEAMRRIIEDQRKRILARKEEVKRNEAQMTLGFDKMELQQMEEERKDWDKRLTAIGREVDEEPARILKSYEVQAHRVEPIGVVYLWPISGYPEIQTGPEDVPPIPLEVCPWCGTKFSPNSFNLLPHSCPAPQLPQVCCNVALGDIGNGAFIMDTFDHFIFSILRSARPNRKIISAENSFWAALTVETALGTTASGLPPPYSSTP